MGASSSELELLLHEKKHKAKKTERKHSGTNAYVNCRVKIKHVLWYSPLPRLPNRQSHADLWLCLSTLIIWTERQQAAESIPFSLIQGQQQEMDGWLRVLLPLFSSPVLHFLLQPKKQGSKKGSVDCTAEWSFIWLAFHMGADSNQFSCSALPSTVLKEGINVKFHRPALTSTYIMTQKHPFLSLP